MLLATLDELVAAIDSVSAGGPPSAVGPAVRARDTDVPSPSPASAVVFELVIVKSDAVPVCNVMAPAVTPEPVPPDSVSIFASSVVTLSVMLISLLPEAAEALKVRLWPFTVMVSPAAKLFATESVLAPRTAASHR